LNYWLVACINLFGIAGIVGLTYLMIWLFSKRKDSFNIHPNGLLLGALISFSISLATITTGITLAIPVDIIEKIVITVICIMIFVVPAVSFLVCIVFYKNSITVDKNSAKLYEQESIKESY